MKATTKWILGIVIGLLVIAAICVIGYFVFNRWGTFGWVMGTREFHPWDGGRFMPMQPHHRVPGQRFPGVLPLRFIGGSLLFASVLALIILGVIALFRVIQSPQKSSLPTGTATAASTMPAIEQTCSNCKSPVQENWSHCPFCGEQLD